MTSVATPGYLGQLYLAASPSVSLGTLGMNDAGDHKTFNPGNSSKQYFDKSSSFTVQAKQDEVQTVTITGGPTGGTFTLTFGANTTSAIAYNASAATVQAALVALASIGANNVSVSGGPGPNTPWVVEFIGTLGYANQASMTGNFAGLTGGSSPNGNITINQNGSGMVTQSSSTYVINYPIGQVVFNAVLLGTPVVQITAGNYFNAVFFGFCKEFDPTFTPTVLDSTAFVTPASQWKTFVPGVIGATVKLLHWFIDNTMFAHLTAGDTLILALYTGVNANQRWQGYVLLTNEDIKALVNAIITDDLTFTFNGQAFFIPS